MDLARVNGYHVFGLNKIFLLFDRHPMNLSYHVAVNPLVIRQSVKPFASIRCPSFFSYAAARGVLLPQKKQYLIATGGGFGFQGNLLGLLPEGNTVTFVALQIAFFMGFSQVFLIGVDHSYSCAGSPNEKQKLDRVDVNHFDPSYFQNQKWQLPDLEASELAYRIADFHYRRAGRRVYDATLDGKLDVFEKISFDAALAMCTRRLGMPVR
ncbi:MAG: hypothetical protein IH608_06975 [Proteobacteria bacterium]|nr:hypothetical protein [Pseudomonadota bacterium]